MRKRPKDGCACTAHRCDVGRRVSTPRGLAHTTQIGSASSCNGPRSHTEMCDKPRQVEARDRPRAGTFAGRAAAVVKSDQVSALRPVAGPVGPVSQPTSTARHCRTHG